MTQLASDPVTMSNGTARLAITVTSPQVVNHLEGVDGADRGKEVLRLLDLGVELARRAEQRADAVGLEGIRQALATDLGSIRQEINAAIRQLSELASGTTEQMNGSTAQATKVVTEQVSQLPAAVRKAIAAATSDTDLAKTVEAALTGGGSPIEKLEQRLVRSVIEVKQSHDAALAAALGELTSATGALGRLRGAMEQRHRSPAGGTDYEVTVENALAAAALARGDKIFDVRNKVGNGGAKKGDFVTEIDEPQARVAVELKNTETGMSAEAAAEYVRETMTARDTHAVLIVCASHQAMPAGLRGGETIGLVGANGLAVCHPPDGDPQILAVAYALARTIAIVGASGEEAERLFDLDAVMSLVLQARQRLKGIKQVEQGLTRAKNDINSQIKHLGQRRAELLSDLDDMTAEVAKPTS